MKSKTKFYLLSCQFPYWLLEITLFNRNYQTAFNKSTYHFMERTYAEKLLKNTTASQDNFTCY